MSSEMPPKLVSRREPKMGTGSFSLSWAQSMPLTTQKAGTSCHLNGKNFAELVDAGFGLRSGQDDLVVDEDELVPARA
nr:hypothetical protein Itr_chr09CG07280 [Ipomoea trifida]